MGARGCSWRGLKGRSKHLALLVLLFVPVAQGCSSSSTRGGSRTVVATGTIHCSGVSGSVTFAPPLTASGTKPEIITISAHLSHCSTHGSDVALVSGGVATSTLEDGSSACSGLLEFPSSPGSVSTPSTSVPITVEATWAPRSVEASNVRFSGFVVSVSPAGDVGFAFPGVGHNAKVAGSFGGQDDGSVSTASAYTNEGAAQILQGCSQLSGVSSISIASGQVTLG
jgi:hypothetical protein